MSTNVTKCSQGHFYDSKMGYCPVCQQDGAAAPAYNFNPEVENFNDYTANSVTVNADSFGMDAIPPTTPDMTGLFNGGPGATLAVDGANTPGATFALTPPAPQVEEMNFGTIPADIQQNGFQHQAVDPVVGWLVCVSGPNRGRDYRIHSGTNFIGRSHKMDICLENDQTISAEKAASISYDDREKLFFITQGEVRNLIYVNGRAVRKDADLNMYDKIEIGHTQLVFIPLCNERFSWSDY